MTMNMKNWLRAGAALLACIFGLMAFYAFQKADVKSEPELINWYFLGNYGQSRLDSTLYSKTPDPLRPCMGQAQEVCLIKAPENEANYPDFNHITSNSESVKKQIELSLEDPSNPTLNETVKSFRNFSY